MMSRVFLESLWLLAVVWFAVQFVLVAVWSWRRTATPARVVWGGFAALPLLIGLSLWVVVKNTIDWVSRPADGEAPLAAYRGKVAALMAASPGGLGGLRGLVHVRSILSSIGVIVLPDQIAVSRAFEAFDDEGQLKDNKQQVRVQALGESVARTVSKLAS